MHGLPLVEMARVRWQAAWNPDSKGRTPPNQFRHRRELLDAKSRLVVAPNNDTPYPSAFLDLSQGPVALDVPATGGRYFVMQFMDFYTNNGPLSADAAVLRFEPGQLPPVAAFWSLTMYGLPGDWFIDSPVDRYALGDRSKGMVRTAVGALEIVVQRDPPPAEQASNWLPAPSGDFELALRGYLPDAAIVEGRWKPPTVEFLQRHASRIRATSSRARPP